MRIEDIDEVEQLVEKYRMLIAAKDKLANISINHDIDFSITFLAKDFRGAKVCLDGLANEVFGGVVDIINKHLDRVVVRLREI